MTTDDIDTACANALVQRSWIGGHDVATGSAGLAAPLGAWPVAAQHDAAAALGPEKLGMIDAVPVAVARRQDHAEGVDEVLNEHGRVVCLQRRPDGRIRCSHAGSLR